MSGTETLGNSPRNCRYRLFGVCVCVPLHFHRVQGGRLIFPGATFLYLCSCRHVRLTHGHNPANVAEGCGHSRGMA